MSGTNDPTLDAVLESYMLDAANDGALARYLNDYPQFSAELLDLVHQSQRVLPDDLPELSPQAQASVAAVLNDVLAGWPQAAGARNLFATLRPADYGRLSEALNVPRQVIGAVKDGQALLTSIPSGWFRKLADELGGTVTELLASIGPARAAPSFKSEARPEEKPPVPFEQILIEAKVGEERRAEIMSDNG